MCLRYGWTPTELPVTCGCGEEFNVKHALSCLLGGFRSLMHNELQHLYYLFLTEAGFKVEKEPLLTKLSGEFLKYKSANKEADARSDLKVYGFWRRLRDAYFDLMVNSPTATSYQNTKVSKLLKTSENKKNREYKERINCVEHGDFSPLIFTTTGSMGTQALFVTKRIAQKLSDKSGHHISKVMGWLRCRISFALLRSTLTCLRGTRTRRHLSEEINLDLAISQVVDKA